MTGLRGLFVCGLLVLATVARAEISHFNLSTAGEADLGALAIDAGDVFEYDVTADTARLLLDVSAHFLSGGDIDAIHALSDTTFVLSTSGNSTFNNGTVIDRGDVVFYDAATGIVTLLMDDNLHFKDKKGKASSANVNAVQLLGNGNLALSIAAPSFLGGVEITAADYVEYKVSTKSLARTIIATTDFATNNEDIDGAFEKTDGKVVLSTANNNTIGGQFMDKDDIVLYDPVTRTASLLVDGGAILSGTGNTRASALAVRPNGNLVLVANTAALAGGRLGAADVVRYDVVADTSQRIFIGNNFFAANEDVDAVHVASDGIIYLSTDSAAVIGSLAFQREDVVAFNPATGTATMFFDGSTVLSAVRNVDAFYLLDDGRMVLSVTGGDDTLGGLTFSVSDLVRYDPVARTAELLFDGDALFTKSEDVDGVHVLGNGDLLLSTTSSATLGGLAFGPDDIVQFNAAAGTATLVFDGSALFASAGEDVNAVHAEETVVLGNVDHFQIVHAGQGVNCQAEQVTIRAIDAAGILVSDYSGTLTLATSSGNGDWTKVSGNGALVPGAPDSGAATYNFLSSDGGEVILALRDTHVETISINVSDSGGVSENSNNAVAADDPALAFVASGFRFFEGTPATGIQTQISNKSSAVAPNGGGIGLQAIRTDTQTGSCEAFLVGNQDVEMAFSCVSPASCSTAVVSVTGAAATVALPQWNGGANYLPVTLDFGDDTADSAGFSLVYPEAGSIRLYARFNMTPGPESASGQSAAFVVRPFGFGVSGIASGAIPNPAGTATAGTRFIAAGEAFDFSVGAYRWAAGEDDDFDGVPNIGADLTDNGLTTQFSGTVDFAAGDITPTGPGAVSGALGIVSTAIVAGGSVNVSGQTYGEVGSLRLVSSTTDYLAAADADISASSAVIGRFVPDRFALSADLAAEYAPSGNCADGFVYMDEPDINLAFTLQARGAGGGITTNYDVARGYGFAGTVAVVAEDGDSGSDLASRIDLPVSFDWVAGEVIHATTSHTFARNAAPDGPYTSLQTGVQVTGDPVDGIGDPDRVDLDGRTMNAAEVGCGSECDAAPLTGLLDVRHGRVTIASAYGPETEALPVATLGEYFDGARFVTNSADQCTTLVAAQFDLLGIDDDSSPDHGSDPAAGTLTVAVDTGSTTALIANSPFVNGDAGLVFSAPGLGNTGYVDIDLDLSSSAWLLYDWDGNGSHAENPPTARAVFGRYRGDDRIIYWREVLD